MHMYIKSRLHVCSGISHIGSMPTPIHAQLLLGTCTDTARTPPQKVIIRAASCKSLISGHACPSSCVLSGIKAYSATRNFGPCALSTLRSRRQRLRRPGALIRFSEEEIEVDPNLLGTLGVLQMSRQSTGGMDHPEADSPPRQSIDKVTDSGIQARLYRGRIVRGKLQGTRVLLKAYPAGQSDTCRTLAANELAAHAALQPPVTSSLLANVVVALGSFSPHSGPSAGDQWIVLRNDGATTAAAYAMEGARAGVARRGIGGTDFLDLFDSRRLLARRRIFVREIIRQALSGVGNLHNRRRLHQSLGPASLLLTSVDERAPQRLKVNVADLALSVDASDEALFGGATLSDIWERGSIYATDPLAQLGEALWMRARTAGAWSETDRRLYGIADDVFAAGLLVAHLAFVPFCQPGSIDGPTLQRLLETFRSDAEGLRDYCSSEDRWDEAVAFLDESCPDSDFSGGSRRNGWHLLTAMTNPEWRLRPTMESCLNHSWLQRN